MSEPKTYENLLHENRELAQRLEEATETIEAIRTGQVDALVVNDARAGHQLYTLKTADQTYRVFIEKMNEGAVTLNENGIILYANSKFATMIGTELSGIVGIAFETFVSKHCQELFHKTFLEAWDADINMEFEINSKTEVAIPCQLSLSALKLDEGPSLSVIVTALTNQKNIQRLLKENNARLTKINAELEASNHDLQQFASIASHDLQEPLRKILIFSNILKDKHATDWSQQSLTYLEKIISSSLRMRTLASDILNYSSLSADSPNQDIVNLQEIVQELMEDYEILLNEKNVTITTASLPVVEGNRAQLKQVFQNLISNSIKFSRDDVAPVIKISCQQQDIIREESPMLTCHIVFEDNGIGFNDVHHERIFSLFERLNTKDKYEGSGIGLAITRKIVEKHNGEIHAESTPGVGTRFTIILPVRQPVSREE